jgi:hypothetical protein
MKDMLAFIHDFGGLGCFCLGVNRKSKDSYEQLKILRSGVDFGMYYCSHII